MKFSNTFPHVVPLVLLVGLVAGCSGGGGDDPGRDVIRFRAVTFNTGSGGATGTLDGSEFTSELKGISDELYGNGLAWVPAVDKTREWLAEVDPDVIAFQEIFHTGDCADIPAADREQFVCEGWEPGAETVARMVLGQGYQVMCHVGHPDKCAAVKIDFGLFRECPSDLCLEGMAGAPVPDCGRGSRVGRGTIDLAGGGSLTLVNVHGSSGVTPDDMACRARQVDQVFVDLGTGDGQPAASGARNLILGDLNTDPVRWASFDESAARWLDFVLNPDDPEGTADRAFWFLSEAGEDAVPTYAAMFNIDHVVSNAATGSCFVPGVTPGHPHVLGGDLYFDHKPVVCDLTLPTR